MKSNTPDLLKFRRLMRRLNESKRGIAGLLELLWIGVAKNCPEGDIGRFANEDIAILCDWEGDPDTLIEALVDCGWVDQCDEYRLVIHDWETHCPTYVRGVLKRHNRDFVAPADGAYLENKDPNKNGENPYLANKEINKGLFTAPPDDPYSLNKGEELTKEVPKEPTKEPTKEVPISGLRDPDPDLLPSLAKPSLAKPSLVGSANKELYPHDEIKEVFQEWNDAAAEWGWVCCVRLTSKRRTAIAARLREPFFRDSWRDALIRAGPSRFLRGDTDDDRNWRADLEWFLRPDTVVRVLEGKYDDKAKAKNNGRQITLLDLDDD